MSTLVTRFESAGRLVFNWNPNLDNFNDSGGRSAYVDLVGPQERLDRIWRVFVPLIIAIVVGLALWLRPWPLFLASDESRDPRTSDRSIAWEFGKWVERQARARGLNVRGVARSVPIVCPKCGNASNYFVYPAEVLERCWRASLKPLPTPLKGNHQP